MGNPESLGHHNFAPYVAFDHGKCTVPNCGSMWERNGYAVGCQTLPDRAYRYGDAAFWYSLPGQCASKIWSEKNDDCEFSEPGGKCEVPDGTANCTWGYVGAGEVGIAELEEVDYPSFCAGRGREWNPATDVGTGTSLGWQDELDQEFRKGRESLGALQGEVP